MRQVDDFVAAFVREQGIAADEAARILILLEELLTNLTKYGYPDRAEPGQAEVALAVQRQPARDRVYRRRLRVRSVRRSAAESRRAARRPAGRRTRSSPPAFADRRSQLRTPQRPQRDSTRAGSRIGPALLNQGCLRRRSPTSRSASRLWPGGAVFRRKCGKFQRPAPSPMLHG